MVNIGIMQGRLCPSPGSPLQTFPAATWQEEFRVAQRLGFQMLEWLFEADAVDRNPLFSTAGVEEIGMLSRTFQVRVDSVCAHYFIQRPVLADVKQAATVLRELIVRCGHLRIRRIVLPWLEDNAVRGDDMETAARDFLTSIIGFAEGQGIVLALELDLPASSCLSFIDRCQSPSIKLCYDTGNASADSRDILFEIRRLLHIVAEIHLKDRVPGGRSQPLGDGGTRLTPFLRSLSYTGYRGPLVLETPPGATPESTAARQLDFVKASLAVARA